MTSSNNYLNFQQSHNLIINFLKAIFQTASNFTNTLMYEVKKKIKNYLYIELKTKQKRKIILLYKIVLFKGLVIKGKE